MPIHRVNNGSKFYYAVWGIQEIFISDILLLFLVKNAIFCQKKMA